MSEAYKTVYVGDTAEIVEKKSRFIANLEHVESEEEALALLVKLIVHLLHKHFLDIYIMFLFNTSY